MEELNQTILGKLPINNQQTTNRYELKKQHKNILKNLRDFRYVIVFTVILVYLIKFTISPHKSEHTNTSHLDYALANNRRLLTTNTIQWPSEVLEQHHENCTQPAILAFPADGLTRYERQHGWIIIHIILALYSFWFLATICGEYLVPAIEQMCLNFNVERDVIGATFLAAAVSCPSLFMNCVGTFITKDDVGVSTIVGSAIFNILAVPACCGLFVDGFIHLDWWPVTRDCLLYCIAVFALIISAFDGRIMWHESLLLVVFYFAYMLFMYNSSAVARNARKLISKYRRTRPRPYRQVNELTPLLRNASNINNINASIRKFEDVESCHQILTTYQNKKDLTPISTSSEDCSTHSDSFAYTPWTRDDRHIFKFIFYWPINFLLWLTVPDSRKHPNWKYITIIFSICWLAVISYSAAYLITVIGDTLDIPDSVMGLTVLAAGMSIPEGIASVIVTKQGQGAMGISNSLGSNTFDILLCLGLPWFIKGYFLPDQPNEHWVNLGSTGFTYAAIFLLTSLFSLHIAFVANRFVLDLNIGRVFAILYMIVITIATLIELNIFFPFNLPICDH